MKLTDLIKPEHMEKASWTDNATLEFFGEGFEASVQRMYPYLPLVREAMQASEQHGMPFHLPTAMAMMNWIDRAVQIATKERPS